MVRSFHRAVWSTGVACAVLLVAFAGGSASGEDAHGSAKKTKVELKDAPADHLDILFDGKVAARYMYAYDKSTPERLAETFKPYLHVFDADGQTPITKGPGGEYPHHHGIFIGWNKITVGDKLYDRWHMKGGEIVHERFADQAVKGETAQFTAINDWNNEEGKPFMVEKRTTSVMPGGELGRVIVDCNFVLAAGSADVILDGDPEHAGIHYRPSDSTDREKTSYVYPKEDAKPHADLDYPWVGMTYTMKDTGKQYSVVELSDPKNPTGTRWSAYRNYGRFGAFPKAKIAAGESLTLRYRFMIFDGPMPELPVIQKGWASFSGEPSGPEPKVTVLPAEKAGPPKPATKPTTKASTKPTTKPAAKRQAAAPTSEPAEVAIVAATTVPATTKPAKKKTPRPGPVDAPILFPQPTPKPLSPEEAMKTFKLPEGLHVELAASEPMVEEPIAMSFDEKGRMWVVEMRGYMQDVEATGEDDPTGRIKCLEDTDHDGKFDKSTVFLDGLVLPRAVLPVYGGVLVGTPPELAFWEDTDHDGKADKKTVVSMNYGTAGGQPEHMANTPMVAQDNWIYSAAHPERFKMVRGQWITEPSRTRGQWGLSQDDVGRLFFSSNSDVGRADPLPTQYFLRNPYYPKPATAQNIGLMTTQVVWPSHPTPGVNRGYDKGQLRDDGTLATATAACGAAIYRGDVLPGEYYGNFFTPEPSGNLIKRMTVADTGGKLAATNAYADKDFLTSTDERFRPVMISTGPDGAMYVVDMYKGVLQHYYFLTHYLIKNIKQRELESPNHWGRIYRIVSDKKPATTETTASAGSRGSASMPGISAVALPTDAAGLVSLLGSPNGWTRDTAQRLLVAKNDKAALPLLKKVVRSDTSPLARLHALWTLEGLGRIDLPTVRVALADSDARVRAAAIRAGESLLAPATRPEALPIFLKMSSDLTPTVQLQLVLSVGGIADASTEQVVAKFLTETASDPDLMRDAALSGLRGRELEMTERLLAMPEWKDTSPAREATLTELARCVMAERRTGRVGRLVELADAEPKGAWRQKAILTGVSPRRDAEGKLAVGKLIYLDAVPKNLSTLEPASGDDKTFASIVEGAISVLAWPGKPGVPPAPVIQPLSADEQTRFERGKMIFGMTCAACHQPTGQGLEGLAPPLADSEWVEGPQDRIVRIVLQGLTGPVSVNGVPFKLEMPALPTMSDGDLAAVLTYVRREWEHAASPVDEKTVAKIRLETKDRVELWTARELQKLNDHAGSPQTRASLSR